MAIEIRLPDLGEGIESGDVLDVLVKTGDQIGKDQGVLELETDKATVEVPSSHAGRVAQVLVSVGQTVKVGDPLLTLETATAAEAPPATPPEAPVRESEETPPAAATSAPSPPQPEQQQRRPVPPAERTSRPEPQPASPSADATAEPKARPEPARVGTSASTRPHAADVSATSRPAVIPAGPAIRRFAREVGVDLSAVIGRGEGGRITREDVLEVVRRANTTSKQEAARRPASASSPLENVPGEPSSDDWGPTSIDAMPRIRRTIAAKMFESWSSVPRVTNFDDADVTELEKIRQSSKSDYGAKGIKLTSLPFVIKAVSMALRDHPVLNASVDMENGQAIYHRYVNVGIAVDTDRGLLVPALRNTDEMSIADIARSLAVTADRVRDNDFTIDDLRGSTFTISNLGAIGGTYSTPIINVPEVAILLVGRSRKLPVVVEDQVVPRLMMPLSLSYDHRLVDGAAAARFLNEVIGYLQAPGRLLLAP